MPRQFPRYTRGELVADGCVHATGVTFSLVAAAAMMTLAVNPARLHFFDAKTEVAI